MSDLRSIAISAGLIGSGVLALAVSSPPLAENTDLDIPLNPLGINQSPYGEVFAMAMQSPIETYFHEGMGEHHHYQEDGEECESCDHDHGDHDHADHHDKPVTAQTPIPSPTTRFRSFLTSLDKVAEVRTNPRGNSENLKRYLRRKTEDKLRFAYNLDPSHYGNYNSLHFFLSEPGIGTRPELTPTAASLADDTIRYCLSIDNDPRPALTAAAAATNVIHLMFNDRHSASPRFTTADMRQYLNLTNHCLERYTRISHEWTETGNWNLLSEQRIQETLTRFTFISKVRDAAEVAIFRFESATPSSPVTSLSPPQPD